MTRPSRLPYFWKLRILKCSCCFNCRRIPKLKRGFTETTLRIFEFGRFIARLRVLWACWKLCTTTFSVRLQPLQSLWQWLRGFCWRSWTCLACRMTRKRSRSSSFWNLFRSTLGGLKPTFLMAFAAFTPLLLWSCQYSEQNTGEILDYCWPT